MQHNSQGPLTTVDEIPKSKKTNPSALQIKSKDARTVEKQSVFTRQNLVTASNAQLARQGKFLNGERKQSSSNAKGQQFFEQRTHRTQTTGANSRAVAQGSSLGNSKSSNQGVILSAPRQKELTSKISKNDPELTSYNKPRANSIGGEVINQENSNGSAASRFKFNSMRNSLVVPSAPKSIREGAENQQNEILGQKSVQVFSQYEQNSFEDLDDTNNDIVNQQEPTVRRISKNMGSDMQLQAKEATVKGIQIGTLDYQSKKIVTSSNPSSSSQFKLSVQRRQQKAKQQQTKQVKSSNGQVDVKEHQNKNEFSVEEKEDEFLGFAEIDGPQTERAPGMTRNKSRRLIKPNQNNSEVIQPQAFNSVHKQKLSKLPINRTNTSSHSIDRYHMGEQQEMFSARPQQLSNRGALSTKQRKNIPFSSVPSLPDLPNAQVMPNTIHNQIESSVYPHDKEGASPPSASTKPMVRNSLNNQAQAAYAHVSNTPMQRMNVLNNLGQRTSRVPALAASDLKTCQIETSNKINLVRELQQDGTHSHLNTNAISAPRKLKESRQLQQPQLSHRGPMMLKMASIDSSNKKLSRGEARTTKGAAKRLQARNVLTAPVEDRLQDATSEIERLKNEIAYKNQAYSSLKQKFDNYIETTDYEKNSSFESSGKKQMMGNLKVLRQSSSSQNMNIRSSLNTRDMKSIGEQVYNIRSSSNASIGDGGRNTIGRIKQMPIKKKVANSGAQEESNQYLLPLRARRSLKNTNSNLGHMTGSSERTEGSAEIQCDGTTGETNAYLGNKQSRLRARAINAEQQQVQQSGQFNVHKENENNVSTDSQAQSAKLYTSELRKRLYKPQNPGQANSFNTSQLNDTYDSGISGNASNGQSIPLISKSKEEKQSIWRKQTPGKNLIKTISSTELSSDRNFKQCNSQSSPLRQEEQTRHNSDYKHVQPKRQLTTSSEDYYEERKSGSLTAREKLPSDYIQKPVAQQNKVIRIGVAKRRVEEHAQDYKVDQKQYANVVNLAAGHIAKTEKKPSINKIEPNKNTSFKDELTGIQEETSRTSDQEQSSMLSLGSSPRQSDMPTAFIKNKGSNTTSKKQSGKSQRRMDHSLGSQEIPEEDETFRSTGTMFGKGTRKDGAAPKPGTITKVRMQKSPFNQAVAFNNNIEDAKEGAQKTANFQGDTKELKPTLIMSSSSPNFKTKDLMPNKNRAEAEPSVNPFAAIFSNTPKQCSLDQHEGIVTPKMRIDNVDQQMSSVSQNRVQTPIHPNQIVDGINFVQVEDSGFKISTVFAEAEKEFGADYEPIKVGGGGVRESKEVAKQVSAEDDNNSAGSAHWNSQNSIKKLKDLQKKKKKPMMLPNQRKGPKVVPNAFYALTSSNQNMKSTKGSLKQSMIERQKMTGGINTINSGIAIGGGSCTNQSSQNDNSVLFGTKTSFLPQDISNSNSLIGNGIANQSTQKQQAIFVQSFVNCLVDGKVSMDQEMKRNRANSQENYAQIPEFVSRIEEPNQKVANMLSPIAQSEAYTPFTSNKKDDQSVNKDIFYTPNKDSILAQNQIHDNVAAFEITNQQSIVSRRKTQKQNQNQNKFKNNQVEQVHQDLPPTGKAKHIIEDKSLCNMSSSPDYPIVADESHGKDSILGNTFTPMDFTKCINNAPLPKQIPLLAAIPQEQESSPGMKMKQLDYFNNSKSKIAPIKFTKDFQATTLNWEGGQPQPSSEDNFY